MPERLPSVFAVLLCMSLTAPSLANDLPIEVQQLARPDSLHRVHLYDLRSENLPEGSEIEFVGRYVKSRRVLALCDPPWIHVTWKREDRPWPGIQQMFHVRPDRLPDNTADGAMFRIRGVISRNRPDLTYHQREQQKLHHFNLEVAELKPIEVTVTDETARATFAREIERAKPRLQTLCAKHGLTYVGPRDLTPSLSWYQGKMAVTDIVSEKPRFSFAPIPYATASIVIGPSSGKPVKLVLQRRVHQDPRD